MLCVIFSCNTYLFSWCNLFCHLTSSVTWNQCYIFCQNISGFLSVKYDIMHWFQNQNNCWQALRHKLNIIFFSRNYMDILKGEMYLELDVLCFFNSATIWHVDITLLSVLHSKLIKISTIYMQEYKFKYWKMSTTIWFWFFFWQKYNNLSFDWHFISRKINKSKHVFSK